VIEKGSLIIAVLEENLVAASQRLAIETLREAFPKRGSVE
jgi:hypothetical protein